MTALRTSTTPRITNDGWLVADVVYFVRPGDDNPELRYSLRSLTNIDHGDVWIVGHKPSWVRNVRHIDYEADPSLSKWENVTEATRLAVEQLPDEWVLFNDDFFAVKPTRVPLWHQGRLKTVARPGNGATWRAGKYQTARLLQSWGCDIIDYELHVPMPVDNEGMREALRRTSGRIVALQRRSLYANLVEAGGEHHVDVAVGQGGSWRFDWDWVATNDVSFRSCEVGERIRDLFPTPSPFEGPGRPVAQTRAERFTAKKSQVMKETPVEPRYQNKKTRLVRRVTRNEGTLVKTEAGWAPESEDVEHACAVCGFVAKSAAGLSAHERSHVELGISQISGDVGSMNSATPQD